MTLNISKYGTSPKPNKFSSAIFDGNLKQANLKLKLILLTSQKRHILQKKKSKLPLLIRWLQIKQNK